MERSVTRGEGVLALGVIRYFGRQSRITITVLASKITDNKLRDLW